MMLRIPWIEHDQILERRETITSPIIEHQKRTVEITRSHGGRSGLGKFDSHSQEVTEEKIGSPT